MEHKKLKGLQEEKNEEDTITSDQSQQQLLLGWKSLSESALKRKTIAEITDYLSQHDVLKETLLMQTGSGKRHLKKADLLEAVHELHSNNGN